MFSGRSLFDYDLNKKEVTNQCNLYPTEVNQQDMYWLYASNNKYDDEALDCEKIGKWMLFPTKDQVNATWDKIKEAIMNGDLWESKVSTTSSKSGYQNHAIMIYTKDHTDLNDVINVLDFLESSGIKPSHQTIRYKTDQQTRDGVYSGGGQKPWIYASDTIRGGAPSTAVGRSYPNWRDKTN